MTNLRLPRLDMYVDVMLKNNCRIASKILPQSLVLKLAQEGVSVTFISSEIEEMLRTCSRLIVMRDRRIVGELKDGQLTQDCVMRTIAGGGN